jgi:simple sugar transport system permease protein
VLYALSGCCAALGGVVSTLGNRQGDPLGGTMLELDAIAAVAIGGTLLTGGVGYVLGTVLGVFILTIIVNAIPREGTIDAPWTRIVIGLLLLAFILLQKLIQSRADNKAGAH